MKNMFSLVSTYINWSSLSLPTARMRKSNDSCMVSAAHPLVKLLLLRSYRLFRFRSFRYVTKGVIFIGSMIGNIGEGGVHPKGEVWCVQL